MRRAMMELFGEDGPLARAIRGYRPRPGQIAMARAVADIRGRQTLEAGTGIGKTFAYLAPILQNGMSAVISTGTRALQDQLFHRDIPFLIKALNRPARATMLKGRSNYVCRRNVAAPSSPQLLKDERGDWARIVDFASRDEEGDIAAAADVAADSPAWGAAVSTRDSCPAQQCDFYENCFLYRARARARQADIIVVNHHLFLADMRLREESIAELLPNRDIVVFDEAHLLPSLAPSYFGESVAAADIRRMLSDIARESSRRELPPSLPAAAKKLQATLGMFLECSEPLLMKNKNASNIPAQDAMKNGEWKSAAMQLQSAVAQLRSVVVSAAENAPADQSMILSSLASRAAAVEKKMQAWLEAAKNEIGEGQSSQDSNNGGEGDDENGEEIPSVCWLQGDKRSGGLSLHIAPVSGREIFRRAWDNCKNIVMTSATLTVSGDFGNFARETGMDDANMQSWPSPFDYGRRAMLYLPGSIPDPKTRERFRLHRAGDSRRAAAAARQRGAGVCFVFKFAGDGRGRGDAFARVEKLPHFKAGRHAQRCLAERISRRGQRGAGGKFVVLAGGGHARRRAVIGGGGQDSVFAADRPAAEGARRLAQKARRKRLYGKSIAGGGNFDEASGGTADARLRRLGRVYGVRPPPVVARLRQGHSQFPPANAGRNRRKSRLRFSAKNAGAGGGEIGEKNFHSRESGNLFPRQREIPRSGNTMSPVGECGCRRRDSGFRRNGSSFNFAVPLSPIPAKAGISLLSNYLPASHPKTIRMTGRFPLSREWEGGGNEIFFCLAAYSARFYFARKPPSTGMAIPVK